MVQIVWFKRDLRTVDHLPLSQAAAHGPILPLYIVEPGYWALDDTSRRHYLAQISAVEELKSKLAQLGAPLIIRIGEAEAVFRALHAKYPITQIHAHEETGNGFTFARDRAIRRFAREASIGMTEYPQFGVIRRMRDRDSWASGHRTFINDPIVPAPTRLLPVAGVVSDDLPTPEAMGLLPDGCDRPQPGTRASALRLLNSFFAGRGGDYRRAMSRPLEGAKSCSRLSVALSTGAISIREVLQRCFSERGNLAALDPRDRPIPLTSIDSLIARLHWHCHFIQKLETEPDIEWRSQHALHEAARRPTEPDDPALDAWATGRTGLPFVDACMRSLIATGWLNFRMRAMVQAIASYHLALDWRASGTRLACLFTDYEPGIHWPQVQMQSGQTGINTPRIYNPVKQGYDQDPEGHFVRRWVPELAGLPNAAIHEPWRLDAATLAETGVVLGQTYPHRLIDPTEGMRAARARLTEVRRQAGYRGEAQKVYQQHGSRKRQGTRSNAQVSGRKTKKSAADVSSGQLPLFPDL